jgi:hypothetical protein
MINRSLRRPILGVCRGIVIRDCGIVLLNLAIGIFWLAAGAEAQGLMYLWAPVVVMPLLIWLRRELLPRAIAQAYDILKSDIRECLTADGFRQLVRVFFDHVMGVIKWVATSIAAVFFFVVRFLFCVLAPLASSVRARARFAWESTSFRRSLFLTHSHTLRAPPALA